MRISLGTLTGGGALGNLIPPSIFLLVYAIVVQQSVIDLFVATIIPGAIAVMMFMGVRRLARRCATRRSCRRARRATAWRGRGRRASGRSCRSPRSCWRSSAACTSGLVTPTEAAGFGCLSRARPGAYYRELTYRGLRTALINTIAVTCVMSLLVVNGQILGFAVVQADIGRGMSRRWSPRGLLAVRVLRVLFLLYLALGTFLDGISMMLLTVPVLYPTLKRMGFDDIWFGVILVIQAELAQLSPPVGLNLLAVQSIASDVDMGTITRASLPYAFMLSALCFLLYFLPQLATWLPRAMRRSPRKGAMNYTLNGFREIRSRVPETEPAQPARAAFPGVDR